MGMATPDELQPVDVTIGLHLVPAIPDQGLTCMLCWGSRVDWETTFRAGGRRVTVGLHDACVAGLEKKGGRSR